MTETASSVLPVVRVADLPSAYDEPLCTVGTVSGVEVTPSQSGEYQRVHLTLAHGQNRTAHIRFNLKPEWLTPPFAAKVRAGLVADKEAIQYRINVAGLWRGLFRAVDMAQTDLEALRGKQVGVRVDYRYDKQTGLPKNDAPEVQAFFPAAEYEKQRALFEDAAAKRKAAVASTPDGAVPF